MVRPVAKIVTALQQRQLLQPVENEARQRDNYELLLALALRLVSVVSNLVADHLASFQQSRITDGHSRMPHHKYERYELVVRNGLLNVDLQMLRRTEEGFHLGRRERQPLDAVISGHVHLG